VGESDKEAENAPWDRPGKLDVWTYKLDKAA
jgi:hypothetical protein